MLFQYANKIFINEHYTIFLCALYYWGKNYIKELTLVNLWSSFQRISFLLVNTYIWKIAGIAFNFIVVQQNYLRSATWNFFIVILIEEVLGENN